MHEITVKAVRAKDGTIFIQNPDCPEKYKEDCRAYESRKTHELFQEMNGHVIFFTGNNVRYQRCVNDTFNIFWVEDSAPLYVYIVDQEGVDLLNEYYRFCASNDNRYFHSGDIGCMHRMSNADFRYWCHYEYDIDEEIQRLTEIRDKMNQAIAQVKSEDYKEATPNMQVVFIGGLK